MNVMIFQNASGIRTPNLRVLIVEIRTGKHRDFHLVFPGVAERVVLYKKYYNEVRTHLSLEKDTPVSRAVERTGHILCRPVLGGLHLSLS
jgi:hypothetical protein